MQRPAPTTPGLLERPVGRRRLLGAGGAAAGLLLLGELAPRPAAAAARARLTDPFTLGVASGDPLPDGVVLWTRLAPDPLHGGGMPDADVPVDWEVAADERFAKLVRRGSAVARPGAAHSVHVDVRGLDPAAWYWYRFRVDGQLSPVGRTRTAPAAGSSPERLRFAFVSCQDYQAGFWPAWENLAGEDLDLVVHLGDYVYETARAAIPIPRGHVGGEARTLADYRTRHAQYKTDPALQAAHAAFPFVLTYDDHEVENNYAGAVPENPAEAPGFLARRAAAYRAWWEHLPLRVAVPAGPDALVYRRFAFGDLAELSVLDTRQYRTDQPCGDNLRVRCAAALDPDATMTGPEQERWLLSGLDRSAARWNVIAQQTMMAQMDFLAGPGQLYLMDQWDGYVAARNRLLAFLLHRRPSNPVVISGDIHSSWVADLKADFAEPRSATVATEFVGTSISSAFPSLLVPLVDAALHDNPHVRYFDGVKHGYVRCELDRQRWRSDFRVVPTVLLRHVPASTAASFEVDSGQAGAGRV
jgi:alkaline phosphatase D